MLLCTTVIDNDLPDNTAPGDKGVHNTDNLHAPTIKLIL